jgi:hypothetical protein
MMMMMMLSSPGEGGLSFYLHHVSLLASGQTSELLNFCGKNVGVSHSSIPTIFPFLRGRQCAVELPAGKWKFFLFFSFPFDFGGDVLARVR